MLRLFLPYLLILSATCTAQNVNIEIADLNKTLNDKQYATYQLVNASYSASRPTITIITTKQILISLAKSLKTQLKSKQEFTDIWILGIADFHKNEITESDKTIIQLFFNKINKYRIDNELVPYSMKVLDDNKIIIDKSDRICDYLNCKRLP